jgi:hypothetical protein
MVLLVFRVAVPLLVEAMVLLILPVVMTVAVPVREVVVRVGLAVGVLGVRDVDPVPGAGMV